VHGTYDGIFSRRCSRGYHWYVYLCIGGGLSSEHGDGLDEPVLWTDDDSAKPADGYDPDQRKHRRHHCDLRRYSLSLRRYEPYRCRRGVCAHDV
jgi:hypothetical protein